MYDYMYDYMYDNDVYHQTLMLTNDLNERDEQISMLKQQATNLQTALSQKEKMYEQDALVRMQLGKKLEQVLMDKEEVMEENELLQVGENLPFVFLLMRTMFVCIFMFYISFYISISINVGAIGILACFVGCSDGWWEIVFRNQPLYCCWLLVMYMSAFVCNL